MSIPPINAVLPDFEPDLKKKWANIYFTYSNLVFDFEHTDFSTSKSQYWFFSFKGLAFWPCPPQFSIVLPCA
jgi:hypothetical protein